jgi:Ni/Co efflux regulator RcnB
MIHHKLMAALLSASLVLQGTALAQGHEHDRAGQDNSHGQSNNRGQGSQARQQQARQMAARNAMVRQNLRIQQRNQQLRNQERNQRWRSQQNQAYEQHDDERGAGPDHAFHRGGRLPMAYRSRQYVVDDWRGHQLQAPPRGYHWVQTGGDYVLVAIATGVILQLLLGSH